MAMVMDACCAGYPVDVQMLATDLSAKVLEKAIAGRYSERVLEPVPRHYRQYFQDTGQVGPEGRVWEVQPELRRMVMFKRLNLAKPPFPMNGPMDLIFCRNVLIYLDTAARQALTQEAERLLRPGGLLMIGHAETLTGLNTSLRMVRPSVFRKDGPC